MRFSYITSLAFAGAAFAAPIVDAPEADIADVSFVIEGYKTIITNANSLITKVNSLKADATSEQVIAVLKEMSGISGSTIAISEKMTADINAKAGQLTTAAVAQVAKPSAEVATSTVTIVNTLVAKKALFVKAKVQALVLDDLNKVSKTADDFVTAAKLKIPAQYSATGNKYFGQLQDALKTGIKNFSA